MEDTTLSVAKEITLATIPRIKVGGDESAENYGEKVGKLFKVILKHVKAGYSESSEPPKTARTVRF